MGCVCSSRSGSDRKERKDAMYADGAVEVGTVGDRKSNNKLFDSGELRVVPAKAVAGKVLRLLLELISLLVVLGDGTT
ncbi:hypothetical protein B296_00032952 [Ensete ventricosum]|uniref:Uncharacterized protein n=1 Tax=Ensete ventricosum TaxID=4639 RepID=A0A426ZH97_ENSVE|nr:hypothetical protein B296_00032952 [Ensete ventricosum]